MSSIGTGYDLGLFFSPDGRLFQAEYAYKAVENASTCIGIKCEDGVILALEKVVTSKLLKPRVNNRIGSVDRHIGIATTGFIPDGQHIVKRARDEATSWRDNYGSPIPGTVIADRLGNYVQLFTCYSSVRPFGVMSFVATYDSEGPHLYMVEPNGVYWGYNGAAAGKGRQVARNELEKLNFSSLKMKDAVKEAARILYATHDEENNKEHEIEMTWVGVETNGIHTPVPDELLQEAEAYARRIADGEEEDIAMQE
ncbi:putative proteasome subunit alpha type-7 [Schizosaccharomyces pombe]|uniref:Probable proteasome subunit alpha type-7 n=1 Tax=Schizosaccharomyces pombe (strain 972 / ATCC 24843) TaxID=284812 RepID=PSA7_SCHPO|nr:putative proteasome core particle subunit alpha 7 Pre10 [Schizosaccharomyces pombe]O59770.1 RecName: Full=Probable proteasome subunit alpha type-7 [Schizosaccharomyces pombe 972h-]CAA18639.1 20S proteasome component alpha 7, Pre10 (predicted) [Schizosaccharomyces pombe]|eukprot:NP_588040.1 putative proteasome core particle subunit alpha 7 Pre10 [Schizosaccharomyces pombe]